ncbi:MAG: hypothetical protein R3B09_33735 [Nannocystaceae bacterium]
MVRRQSGGAGAAAGHPPRILPAPGYDGQDIAVGDLSLAYRDALTDQPMSQMIHVDAPLGPEDPGPYFATESVEKGFVMLNIMGFQMASMRAQSGDLRGALNLLLGLADAVDEWLAANPDYDIEDDLTYIRLFIDNLRAHGAEEPPDNKTPEPWPND